jgi:hypothetical protein
VALAAAAATEALGQEEVPEAGKPEKPGKAQETGKKGAPAPPAAPASYTLGYTYQQADVSDGELEAFLVEGVTFVRGSFSLEAHSVVLWADPEKAKQEGGRLAMLVGGATPRDPGKTGPGGEAGETAAPAPPAVPPPDESRDRLVPPDLRQFLGPVIHSIYAEGDVRYRLGTFTVRTDRLFVDFRNGILATGKVTVTTSIGIKSRQRSLPLLVRAERMRRVATDTLLLQPAVYTTCDFAEPHYCFKATSFEITDQEDYRTFTAYGSVLHVEGVPVFYLPYISGSSELSSGLLRNATLRKSSRFGVEEHVLLGDDILTESGRWGEWRLNTDYKARRGPGIGPEVKYDTGDKSSGYEGELKTYYQRDDARRDLFDDSPVPKADRGRVQWEHRQRLGEGLRLDLSVADFSDRNFQREYLKDEALNDRDPESYASLQWRRGTDEASVSMKYRVNDFRTETTELPDATFRRISEPVPAALVPSWLLDGATFSVDARGGAYERRYDEKTGIHGEGEIREDAVARLEGLRWVGPVSVAPFTTAGTTVWQGLDRPGGNTDRTRGDLATGLRMEIEARRDFEDVRNSTLDLHGLRHVASLEALAYDRWAVTRDPMGPQAVDRIDTLQEVQVGELRFRNRLQTIRGGERVDWLDLELRGFWFPNGLDPRKSPLRFKEEGLEEDRFSDFVGEEKYRASAPPGQRGPVEADFRARLRENLYFIGEGEYDAGRRRMVTTAEGVRWYQAPTVSIYLGRRAIAADSDIYTATLDWFPSDRWGLRFNQQTDFRNGTGLITEFGIRRLWHDWVLEMYVKNDQGAHDRSFGLSLTPSPLWEPPTSAQKLGRLNFEAQRWYR